MQLRQRRLATTCPDGFAWREPQDPFGPSPYPQLNGDKLKAFNSGKAEANEALKSKKCDEALKGEGIPSLAALLAKMDTSNVFDGKESTLQIPDKNNQTVMVKDFLSSRSSNVPALAEAFGDSKGNITSVKVYLNSSYYNPQLAGFIPFPDKFRAIVLLHEAVHQFGGKHDKDFDSSKGQGDGSTRLSTKIAEACFPAVHSAGYLGRLTF